MFDSKIKAADLIKQIKDEADISYPLPDVSYIMWLNALEQLLYTEVIQEQGKTELSKTDTDTADTSEIFIETEKLSVPTGESKLRFEDIYTIYADDTQLIKTTVTSGEIFLGTYYKLRNGIAMNLRKEPDKLKFIYIVRPELKTEENYESLTVKIPVEFIDLAKAKLRGEAYKIANEDSLAAKWLNDYNILLETFKLWIANKQSSFGM